MYLIKLKIHLGYILCRGHVKKSIGNWETLGRRIDSPTERRKTEHRMTEHRMTERRKTEHRMTKHRMTERRIGPNAE
jgi:hypothetical protein